MPAREQFEQEFLLQHPVPCGRMSWAAALHLKWLPSWAANYFWLKSFPSHPVINYILFHFPVAGGRLIILCAHIWRFICLPARTTCAGVPLPLSAVIRDAEKLQTLQVWHVLSIHPPNNVSLIELLSAFDAFAKLLLGCNFVEDFHWERTNISSWTLGAGWLLVCNRQSAGVFRKCWL